MENWRAYGIYLNVLYFAVLIFHAVKGIPELMYFWFCLSPVSNK